ncbi:hypothetical protein AB6A40_001519 [Gnathostoma spinigerum]|uniref:Protein tyrosine phosphatase n=1 Tax=Gnathostoma spinigerum TaxID=75299 RepID=A0ABD6E4C7_9BILA
MRKLRCSVTIPSHRKAHMVTAHNAEDDGTQIEQSNSGFLGHKKKTSIRRVDTSKADAPMRAFCHETVRVGVMGLLAEFMQIKKESTPKEKLKKTGFDKNPDKNRYKDVYCIDDTRVVLTYPSGENDYIHANYVGVEDDKERFICTQAPMPNTIVDFWRMVWQVKSSTIVMLCDIMECGKKKCEQYWPEKVGESQKHGTLTISNSKVLQVEESLAISKLEVTDGTTTLNVDHIWWSHWPDRGVPNDYLAPFRLLNRLKGLTHIVIHCSAGVGRTGTIVGFEIANQKFNKGEKVSLHDIVTELRLQRHNSVQMDVQYVYMHRCVIKLCTNKKAISEEEVAKFVAQFDRLAEERGAPPKKKK